MGGISVPCAQINCSIDRRKLLTCSLLTGKRTGRVVIRVDELKDKDMNVSFPYYCSFAFFLYVWRICFEFPRFSSSSQVYSEFGYPFQ